MLRRIVSVRGRTSTSTCSLPSPSTRIATRSTFSPSSPALRTISTTPTRMVSLPPITSPLTTSAPLPSDSFQLLAESDKAGPYEDALYWQEIKDVETWWATPRYEGVKRPYTAADVVSKRGSLQQAYPSSLMARKLWDLIQDRLKKGEPIHTSMSFLSLVATCYYRPRPLTNFSFISGCYRSRPDDTTSPPPRSSLPLRVGLLCHPHAHQ